MYALALAAQLLVDGVATLSRLRLLHGMSPNDVLPDLLMVYRVDVLLFPIGLLAAVAAAGAPAAALLVLPLAYLLLSFSLEREASMRKSLELGRAYRGTALLLRDLLEEDDEYTGRHTEDVVGLTVAVAERMGLDEDLRRSAELGALLHDIGKIAVPDEIINKPGPLNDEEWAIMKTHTVEGERMLAQGAACSPTSAWSCARRTSAGTAGAIPTAWPATRSRSLPASCRPATPSTR